MNDDAHEPLIRSASSTEDDPTQHLTAATTTSTINNATTTSQPPHSSTNRATYFLTLTAGLSGLLFGYDTGVISSVLVSISPTALSRPLTTFDKSLITSSTSLFALLFSPLAGYLADSLGRRPVLGVASVLFVLGSALQMCAGSVWVMVTGRSVVGAAVGLASSVAPLFIGECAPKEARGRLVTVQSLFITGGQVVAYLVGWGVQGKWRVAVGLGAVPALLQAGLLGFMDESPRWLVQKGREEDARGVLKRLGGGSRETDLLVKRIREEVIEEEGETGKRGLGATLAELVTVPANRRALTIACMLQGLQQLCGFNSLMYFSATIFTLVGFSNPTTTSLSIALTNFTFTLLALILIDRIGRRRILLLSIPIMILGLLTCAFAFSHLPATTSTSSSSSSSSSSSTIPISSSKGEEEGGETPSSLYPTLLLLSLLLYTSSYATGLGCIPWLQSELFPLSVRSLGSALATTTNWSANAVTAATFLPLMEALGPVGTFCGYAGVCAVGYAGVVLIYPETRGLALEEVGGVLSQGWGVWGGEDAEGGGGRGGG